MAGQPVRLSSEKMNELKEAFKLFDYSSTGKVGARDIGPMTRSIGLKPSEAEIHEMMAEINHMGGEADLATVVELISAKVTDPPAERPEAFRELFSIYDKDGKGTISRSEITHLLTGCGEKLTEEEVDQLLTASGCVQGGQVQYDKFIQVILKG